LAAAFVALGCGPDPVAREPVQEPAREPGTVTTLVGDGTQGFKIGRTLRTSWLNQPTEMAFAPDGRLYIVDWNAHLILRVTDEGTLETLVGGRFPGDWPADVALDSEIQGTDLPINHPMDLAFRDDGALVVAAWHNHKLLDVNTDTGLVGVIVGGNRPGYAGDGGAVTPALLNFPDSLVISPTGSILFADQRNNIVRRIDSDGALSTVVGVKALSNYAGDGELASAAAFALCPYDEAGGSDNPPPGGALALDADGALYIADTFNHCIRRVTPGSDGEVGAGELSEEIVETFAGECGAPGFEPEPDAGSLRFNGPHDLEIVDGALYVADTGNNVVWRIDLESGEPERVTGTGEPGISADGSAALDTKFDYPYGIAFDADGNLYVADTLNNRIRVLWK
jgi:sugar lactone lactonase YvrE